MILRNQSLQDAILACLRSEPFAVRVATIIERMGDNFGYLSYANVATCLYRLQKQELAVKTSENNAIYWQASSATDDLEALWALKPRTPKKNKK